MALTNLGLIVLAYNLTHDTKAVDVQNYEALAPQQKAAVDQLIDQDAPLPPEVEDLLKRSKGKSENDPNLRAPTFETYAQ